MSEDFKIILTDFIATFWGNAKHQYRRKKGKIPKETNKQVNLYVFSPCPKTARTHISVLFWEPLTAVLLGFLTHFQQM